MVGRALPDRPPHGERISTARRSHAVGNAAQDDAGSCGICEWRVGPLSGLQRYVSGSRTRASLRQHRGRGRPGRGGSCFGTPCYSGHRCRLRTPMPALRCRGIASQGLGSCHVRPLLFGAGGSRRVETFPGRHGAGDQPRGRRQYCASPNTRRGSFDVESLRLLECVSRMPGRNCCFASSGCSAIVARSSLSVRRNPCN